jgi:hypothetical protein
MSIRPPVWAKNTAFHFFSGDVNTLFRRSCGGFCVSDSTVNVCDALNALDIVCRQQLLKQDLFLS